MGTYRQYCPIARASEILAERWTPLIIRNLMFGAETFSALARGLPAMSRSMLIKRLGELERAGIITRRSKPNGPGHLYSLTPAGTDLAGVIQELGEWGERWVEVTTEHADPGFALWSWCQVQMNRSALPEERTVVAFTFPEEAPTNRYYWLLADGGEAELCYSDPGDEPALSVVAESLAFVDWHRGRLRWSDAVRDGLIRVTGGRALARSLPDWNLHTPQVWVR
ncbi:MAG TPA: helix-turn-helix domain-containing protein [Acidimicrobiia bacterium]|nr:helix-turn-helix domain-containing protein [Acidimicrobiia bacterium]